MKEINSCNMSDCTDMVYNYILQLLELANARLSARLIYWQKSWLRREKRFSALLSRDVSLPVVCVRACVYPCCGVVPPPWADRRGHCGTWSNDPRSAPETGTMDRCLYSTHNHADDKPEQEDVLLADSLHSPAIITGNLQRICLQCESFVINSDFYL